MVLIREQIRYRAARKIDKLREACRVAANALRIAARAARPGVSLLDLDRIAETYIRQQGATPSFKGYHGFPGTLCTSVNDKVVHGIPPICAPGRRHHRHRLRGQAGRIPWRHLPHRGCGKDQRRGPDAHPDRPAGHVRGHRSTAGPAFAWATCPRRFSPSPKSAATRWYASTSATAWGGTCMRIPRWCLPTRSRARGSAWSQA